MPVGYRRFWASVGITAGLAIFFFGISIFTSGLSLSTAIFDVVVGVFLLITGLLLAEYKPYSENASEAREKPRLNETHEDTNKPRGTPDTKETIKLVEYQVAERMINTNILSFWSLAGIFLGFSSAVLAGLGFALLSSNDLLKAFVTNSKIMGSGIPKEIWTIRILTTIVGSGIVIIILKLSKWLKRVNLVTDISRHRIHEIEMDLGMTVSLLHKAVDNWYELSQAEQDYMAQYKDWCLKTRQSSEYEPPSRKAHYPYIFMVLVGLWIVVILCIWLLPLILSGFGL